MKATITIDMDNAAFDDNPHGETARILRDLANKITSLEWTVDGITLRDLNGNVVGRMEVSD